jgi:DNA-3-methyladenine glycosylase I
MEKQLSYCEAVMNLDANNVHRIYHDTAYGFPLSTDDELFERLVLEINQAGLSWTTILNKQNHFRLAYDHFSIEKVAHYSDDAVRRLLNDTGIIRNRLKIQAAIHNANVILQLQSECGSFHKWIEQQRFAEHTPLERVAIFKKTFKFTGGEIVNEFLMSSGYIPGAHIDGCPIGEVIKKKRELPSCPD